uniref:type IX secretion system outer membrane channel protein PorV n=1 Tax=Flavobacterium sp. TaxID=239 RepID=UPI004049A21E
MKKIALFIVFVFGLQNTFSQNNDIRPITTAVPFVTIAADARSAGMGELGVATSSDIYSQQWNPAKYAFAESEYGFAMSYTPYLSQLVNDISISQVNFFNKFEDRSAFAASFRYFSLGTIIFRTDDLDPGYEEKPSELALDLSYTLKLNPNFSMAVAGRYIRSDLRLSQTDADATAANGFAFDVAGFYESNEVAYSSFNGKWRAGFNFQNMGPKISYDNDPDPENGNFLPATLRLGGGYDFIIDGFNKITVNAELSKLMVPSPQRVTDVNGDGIIDQADENLVNNDYRNTSWVSGLFSSFNDASDGMSEEWKETMWALGAEYVYQDAFALRLGYFNEHETKGARKFYTFGAGFKYNVIKIDVSYLFSASNVRNPLENTLRFSLSFKFGDDYDNY